MGYYVEGGVKGPSIFVLRHEREHDGSDSMIVLGVYANLALAESAKARFATKPGFRDRPDGFIIHPCNVNEDLWSGGFTTYRFPLNENEVDG